MADCDDVMLFLAEYICIITTWQAIPFKRKCYTFIKVLTHIKSELYGGSYTVLLNTGGERIWTNHNLYFYNLFNNKEYTHITTSYIFTKYVLSIMPSSQRPCERCLCRSF